MIMAELHLLSKSPAMALRWIAVVYETRKYRTQPEALALTAIFELVAITMLGDLERLEAALSRYEYTCKSTGQNNAYTHIIQVVFSKIAADSGSMEENLQALCSMLNTLPAEKEYSVLQKSFDLSAWAKGMLLSS